MTTDLNRRRFLQGLITAAVLVKVPASVAAETSLRNWPLFTGEVGTYEGVRFTEVMGRAIQIAGIDAYKNIPERMMIADAKKHLPKGVMFEIRASIPSDFGRSRGIAWYAAPELQNLEPTDVKEYVEKLGIYRLARQRA